MRKVAVDNKLKFGEDVKKQTVGPTDKFFQYLEMNPNNTLYSVVWCSSEWKVETELMNLSLPCQFDNDLKNGS